VRGRVVDEGPPESDRLPDAPHPRATPLLIGHEAAERELLEAYRSGRMHQAWLIGGPQGIGKATLAWRLARFLLSYPDPSLPAVQRAQDLSSPMDAPPARRVVVRSHADVVALRREWDQKGKKHYTEIRIDDVRSGVELFRRAASEGGWRVAIVDSAEDLNKSSANALLKIIEEPPPKSIFLIVAHRPGQTMATIRSRCRKLMLEPLPEAQVVEAVTSLKGPWSSRPAAEIATAARRSGGSVREAILMLGSESLEVIDAAEALLARLPAVDWSAVYRLAEASNGRAGQEAFDALMNVVFDWIDKSLRANAQAGGRPRSLAPYAEVWEKIAASARETQALNLDRRPLVLSIFTDLAAAVTASRA
jgi:DNA polymerase III subunit delta'